MSCQDCLGLVSDKIWERDLRVNREEKREQQRAFDDNETLSRPAGRPDGRSLEQIRQMAENVAAREGCYLYDIEFLGASAGRTLRVTIDKVGQPSILPVDSDSISESEGVSGGDAFGVSVEDCSNVSRGLNLLLDVDDVIPGGTYHLEVSSPGLERVLKAPKHFTHALGKKISVKTFQPLIEFNEFLIPELSKAKQVQGQLVSFDGRSLRIEYQGIKESCQVVVPIDSVTKAHIIHEFSDPSEKKKNLQKKGKAKA